MSADALKDTVDISNEFSNEDKLVECNGDLVYINLDDSGNAADEVLSYSSATNLWTKYPLVANVCPDDGEGSLLPRDSGYSVGSTSGPDGTDRLLIVGGSLGDNNVYYSDNCGKSWDCHDGNQLWNPRSFSPALHPKGIFPGDPIMLMGGLSEEQIFSVMHTQSYNFGIDWTRPYCTKTDQCAHPLNVPDTYGSCSDPVWYKHCYLLPAVPALSGSVAYDTTTMYLFLEKEDVGGNGTVYYLNRSNYATGWSVLRGAGDGGFGRKVFIRGGAPNSGCWFSNDVLAEDLFYYYIPGAMGSNSFMTAPAASGPWTQWDNLAPWTPRAGGALAASDVKSAAWYGGGSAYIDGDLSEPTFSDVWQIDVGVCLLGSGGKVCSGHGSADLFNVVCSCDAGFTGPRCASGSAAAKGLSPGAAAAIALSVIAVVAGGGVWYVGVNTALAFVQPALDATKQVLDKTVGLVSGGGAKSMSPSGSKGISAASGTYGAI